MLLFASSFLILEITETYMQNAYHLVQHERFVQSGLHRQACVHFQIFQTAYYIMCFH